MPAQIIKHAGPYNQRFPVSPHGPGGDGSVAFPKRANVIRYVRRVMTILPLVCHKILTEEQVRLWL